MQPRVSLQEEICAERGVGVFAKARIRLKCDCDSSLGLRNAANSNIM
jgi:hypothetical protein